MSVLVGYAPNLEGRAAVERAVGECRLRETRLVVLLSQPRPPGATPVTAADVDELLAEFGASQLERKVRDADPALDLADQLLEAAEEPGTELMVIGLRRRSPVGKLILGTSAQRILLDAACPVLAVKVDGRDRVQAADPSPIASLL